MRQNYIYEEYVLQYPWIPCMHAVRLSPMTTSDTTRHRGKSPMIDP